MFCHCQCSFGNRRHSSLVVDTSSNVVGSRHSSEPIRPVRRGTRSRLALTLPSVTPIFAAMRKRLMGLAIGVAGVSAVAAVAVIGGGCSGVQPFPRSETDTQLFGPVSMRLHPIFTQVKDWTGDNKPDGIEAL